MKIQIKEPIWKTRSVGLSKKDVDNFNGDIIVEILYANKMGVRIFTSPFKIESSKARTYPTQTVRYGTELYIVPIKDMEII